jgi:D-arabinose 1-dehydrogenase-like Zn-dependent alcohol dehydrogenase
MSTTYRAIEVKKPGEFSEVRKPLLDPGPNQVRVRVEACGVCHSDSATVEGLFPIDWPRVPGHEVVGRIDALGSGGTPGSSFVFVHTSSTRYKRTALTGGKLWQNEQSTTKAQRETTR